MKENELNRKVHMILVVVMSVFCVFYALKLYGLFDFTSDYGITHITSTISDGEGALMMDNDLLTCWNTYDRTVKPGSKIVIYFKNKKSVSDIKLTGVIPEEMKYYYSKDGKWEEYTPGETVKTKKIKLAVSEELTKEEAATIKWQIKELEIYE